MDQMSINNRITKYDLQNTAQKLEQEPRRKPWANSRAVEHKANVYSYIQTVSVIGWFVLWCLTLLSTIFQLYPGGDRH